MNEPALIKASRKLLRHFRRATTTRHNGEEQAALDRDKTIALAQADLYAKNKAALACRDKELERAAQFAQEIDNVYTRTKSLLVSYGLDPSLLDEALKKAPEPK